MRRTRHVLYLLLGGVALLCASLPARAQSTGSTGDEFILAYLPNIAAGTPTIEVRLTGEVSTSVTVEHPVLSPTFTMTVSVTPGSATTVSLPSVASTSWVADSVMNNAVRLSAADPFAVTMVNRKGATSDGALGLPVNALGLEYYAADYDPPAPNPGGQLAVVATVDGTTVTITPSVPLTAGHPAGVPFVVALDRGEAYFGMTEPGATVGLSGTHVTADQPVCVSNGAYCLNVPTTTPACDHVFEVARPVETWDESYLAANLPGRPAGTIYRILASTAGTNVTQDGVALAGSPIDAGQFLEIGPLAGDHVFAADAPITVVQYLTGGSSPGSGQGDPAMGNLIPTDQFETDHCASTFIGGKWSMTALTQHYLVVFAADADTTTITLDGTAIGAGSFTPIAGSGHSVATLPVGAGTYHTQSTAGHGVLVAGYYVGAEAYLYPAAGGDCSPVPCSAEWSAMEVGMSNEVYALIAHDGTGGGLPGVYAGGDFVVSGSVVTNGVARWAGTWQALDTGVDDRVLALAFFGGDLYAAGELTVAGGSPASHIARWDGSNWLPLGTGTDDTVRALVVHDDGGGAALYAGGDFRVAGGVVVNHVARWDGTSWSALGAAIGGAGTPTVHALTSFGSGSGALLVAGGDFSLAGGLPAANVATWDGSSWSAPGTGLPASVLALESWAAGSTEEIYAGGLFPGQISRWDGASWSTVGGGTNGPVRGLAVHVDDVGERLAVGGSFNLVGATPANNVALWDGSSWFALGTGVNFTTRAVCSRNEGFFAGGDFTLAGGIVARHVARWRCPLTVPTVGTGTASTGATSVTRIRRWP